MSPAPWRPSATPVDRGDADPEVRGALASAYSGGDAYPRAIAALCTARLILPTVDAPEDAEPGLSKQSPDDHHGHGDHDRHGDQDAAGHDADHRAAGHEHPDRAVVTLRSASGAKAVLVFTGYDALAAWRPDAHPVRCTLDDVAATVAETGSSAIVVDVAGPHQVVIEGELVVELARGRRLAALPDGTFAWVFAEGGQAG